VQRNYRKDQQMSTPIEAEIARQLGGPSGTEGNVDTCLGMSIGIICPV
jgi:hypothetical protein